MAISTAISKELLERIEAVNNKRARFVLNSIVKNGIASHRRLQERRKPSRPTPTWFSADHAIEKIFLLRRNVQLAAA
jgi:hypothetical protein